MSDAYRDDFTEAYKRFASQGRRVLGFAYKPFSAPANEAFDEDKHNFPDSDLVFVGLTAIMDPPRNGVKDAIARCHTASIKVFMVTGDHSLTASAIAKQVRCAIGAGDGERRRQAEVSSSAAGAASLCPPRGSRRGMPPPAAAVPLIPAFPSFPEIRSAFSLRARATRTCWPAATSSRVQRWLRCETRTGAASLSGRLAQSLRAPRPRTSSTLWKSAVHWALWWP